MEQKLILRYPHTLLWRHAGMNDFDNVKKQKKKKTLNRRLRRKSILLQFLNMLGSFKKNKFVLINSSRCI